MTLRSLFLAILSLPFSEVVADFYELAPINYGATEDVNRVSKLADAISAGEESIPSQPLDRLNWLLQKLDISKESQILVYSKTSLQRNKISPDNPRALYFNTESYVGYVPGSGIFEIMTTDPKLGFAFYIFDEKWDDPKQFVIDRDDSCLSCHGTNRSYGIPGSFTRSVYSEPSGEVIYNAGTPTIEPEMPFQKLWGGYYCTGGFDGVHLGGTVFTQASGPRDLEKNLLQEMNAPTIEKFEKSERYLSGKSDVLNLWLLDHQSAIHNLCIRSSMDYLRNQHVYEGVYAGEPGRLQEVVERYNKHHREKLVRALLFVDEPELPGDGMEPAAAAKAAFEESARRDSKGRSLRDLKLYKNVFKYSCSYMIYSDSFSHMPKRVRELVWQRLDEILNADEPVPGYEHLNPRGRKVIDEILRETIPEYAAIAS